jgi:hypothetical protein
MSLMTHQYNTEIRYKGEITNATMFMFRNNQQKQQILSVYYFT